MSSLRSLSDSVFIESPSFDTTRYSVLIDALYVFPSNFLPSTRPVTLHRPRFALQEVHELIGPGQAFQTRLPRGRLAAQQLSLPRDSLRTVLRHRRDPRRH